MNLQPSLSNGLVSLKPLGSGDFERLFAVACDPRIWEQHPTPTRYQRPVFENYFSGAVASGGAMLIQRTDDEALIGCTRYYDLDLSGGVVKIGYTFFSCASWGQGYNPACKQLMLDHAFGFLDRVRFEVGACNLRSRTAMARLGARELGIADVAYHGEDSHPNLVFEICKADWHGAARVSQAE